ncbi:MAG: DsbA family oxidoreductase [Miltoncostaeaceae bacterium]
MTTHPIPVEVWSDVVCPWCYIGARRLAGGIAELRDDDPAPPPVEVVWRSFQLSPDAPTGDGGPVVDHLMATKGLGREQVQQMMAHIEGIAAGEGLRYDLSGARHTDTRLAHRALHEARHQGHQAALVERLFRAQHCERATIGTIGDLAALGAEAGLDADALVAALEGGAHEAAVDADLARAAQIGVRGVPFAVVDGRYGISGAQPAAVYAEALRRAAADRNPTGAAGAPS